MCLCVLGDDLRDGRPPASPSAIASLHLGIRLAPISRTNNRDLVPLTMWSKRRHGRVCRTVELFVKRKAGYWP